MAVYKRTYKAYEGASTPRWARFLILPHSGYSRLMQSKFLVLYLMACFFFPVLCAVFVYVSHNLSVLDSFNIPSGRIFKIDNQFFEFYCAFQGGMACLLTAFIGPGSVAPDLANRALPLYFSRPFGRAEYVAGKMSLLLYFLSLITWIPGLFVFGVQAELAGWQWTRDNAWMAWSLLAGLLLWDLFLALMALALSASVKWSIAAGALILGVLFAGGGLAAAVNAIVRTNYGSLLNMRQVISVIWSQMFRDEQATNVSAGQAWMALAAASAICVWLLTRRIKAFEVVK
jgi:ABC-2 type transport system permease protein